jgi:hypothetical protein
MEDYSFTISEAGGVPQEQQQGEEPTATVNVTADDFSLTADVPVPPSLTDNEFSALLRKLFPSSTHHSKNITKCPVQYLIHQPCPSTLMQRLTFRI